MRLIETLCGGAIVATLAATPAFAWNDFGHKVIAYIAYRDLTPLAREKVDAILSKHPQYEALIGRDKDGDAKLMAFMGAATWPDMLRSNSNPLHATDHHSQWHYVNIPLSFDGTKGPEPKFDWNPDTDPQNVVQALAKCERDLGDPKLDDDAKSRQVCWLLHLGGDLHQPLHSVALFAKNAPSGDKGGNSFWVAYDDRPVNLHSFWDRALGEAKSASRVKEKAETLRKRKGLRRSDLTDRLRATTAQGWASESAAIAKSTAYLEGKLEGTLTENKPDSAPALPKGYVTSAETESEMRAALAGYRLADELNKIFGSPEALVPAVTEQADCCAYFEPFATATIHDCESALCKVKWCDDAKTTDNKCAGIDGRALKVLAGNAANNDWPVMWIWWGDREIESVKIDLSYGQHEGTASRANQAVAYMEYKVMSTDTFDPRSCRPSGLTMIPGSSMPNTHTIDFACFPLSVAVPVSKGDRGVLVRFCKGKATEFTPLLRIDDLRVTVTPAPTSERTQPKANPLSK